MDTSKQRNIGACFLLAKVARSSSVCNVCIGVECMSFAQAQFTQKRRMEGRLGSTEGATVLQSVGQCPSPYSYTPWFHNMFWGKLAFACQNTIKHVYM